MWKTLGCAFGLCLFGVAFGQGVFQPKKQPVCGAALEAIGNHELSRTAYWAEGRLVRSVSNSDGNRFFVFERYDAAIPRIWELTHADSEATLKGIRINYWLFHLLGFGHRYYESAEDRRDFRRNIRDRFHARVTMPSTKTLNVLLERTRSVIPSLSPIQFVDYGRGNSNKSQNQWSAVEFVKFVALNQCPLPKGGPEFSRFRAGDFLIGVILMPPSVYKYFQRLSVAIEKIKDKKLKLRLAAEFQTVWNSVIGGIASYYTQSSEARFNLKDRARSALLENMEIVPFPNNRTIWLELSYLAYETFQLGPESY